MEIINPENVCAKSIAGDVFEQKLHKFCIIIYYLCYALNEEHSELIESGTSQTTDDKIESKLLLSPLGNPLDRQ